MQRVAVGAAVGPGCQAFAHLLLIVHIKLGVGDADAVSALSDNGTPGIHRAGAAKRDFRGHAAILIDGNDIGLVEQGGTVNKGVPMVSTGRQRCAGRPEGGNENNIGAVLNHAASQLGEAQVVADHHADAADVGIKHGGGAAGFNMLALVIAHGTHKVDLVVAADDLTVQS